MTKKLYKECKKKDYSGYLYILPFFFVVIFFWYVPILVSGWFSLTEYNALGNPSFIGPGNYISLFKDKMFLKSIANTLLFVVTVVPLQTVFGFLIAVWVNKRKTTWLGKFVRNGMFVPSLASLGVVCIVWRLLLNNDQSPLGLLLSCFGIKSSLILGSKELVFPALIIMNALIGTGYYMVLFLAYLVDIPESYYEAAKLDGASDFQIMRYITAPLMKPTTIMIIFLGVMSMFQSFDMIYIMTGGGPGQGTTMTLMMSMYLNSFKYSKIGYGMAIGNVLIILVAGLTFLQRKLLNQKATSLY